MAEDFEPIHHNGMWGLPTSEIDRLTDLFKKTDPMVSHEVFHMMCQDLYAQTGTRSPDPQSLYMREKGFQKVSGLLSAADCESLSSRLSSWDESLQSRAQDFKATQEHEEEMRTKVGPFHWKDFLTPNEELSYMQSVIEKVMRPHLVTIIEDALKSHFRLDHYLLSRTFPSDQSIASFLWHRDGAPRGQIHLMVYLTNSLPDGSRGATECLPFAQSDQIGNKGYTYVSPDNRTGDLDQLELGAKAYVVRPHVKEGEGLLFFSSRILHRGIAPRTNHRDVLTLVFLPDLNPWQKSLGMIGFDRLKARGFGHTTLYRHPAAI